MNYQSGLRMLTDSEVEAVGGGVEPPPIVVRGTRLKVDYTTGGGGTLGYAEGGSGAEPNPTLMPEEGGGGGEQIDPPKETPCVSKSPDGYSLEEINTLALIASTRIAALNDENVEYGIFIYSYQGQLHFTAVFGGNQGESINWNLGVSKLPDGAHIVATVHNHPDLNGIDDRIPSRMNVITQEEGRDWASYDALQNWSGSTRGITVDSKALMYIYTNQTEATYVYDKEDRNTTRASCTLQEPKP